VVYAAAMLPATHVFTVIKKENLIKLTIFTASSRTVFILEGAQRAASTLRCMQRCVHFTRGATFWIRAKMPLEKAAQIVCYLPLLYKGMK
jgi:hypothetical protein